jgi:hypothetical protein
MDCGGNRVDGRSLTPAALRAAGARSLGGWHAASRRTGWPNDGTRRRGRKPHLGCRPRAGMATTPP